MLGYCGGEGEGPVTQQQQSLSISPGISRPQSLCHLIMSPDFIFCGLFSSFHFLLEIVLRIISADNDFQIHCFYGDRSQFYRKLVILHSPLLGVPFCFFIQHLRLCWKSLCTCMLSTFPLDMCLLGPSSSCVMITPAESPAPLLLLFYQRSLLILSSHHCHYYEMTDTGKKERKQSKHSYPEQNCPSFSDAETILIWLSSRFPCSFS